MTRERAVAVKIAYDGSEFFGFQRQPRRTTVEGEIVRALKRVGAIRSPESNGFRSSSRTDRGVSALGNIVSLVTAFPTESLCSAMNSELRNAWAYAIAEVPDDFNPRWARQRWYRYHLPKADQDVGLITRVASRFEGTHDFSGYARKDNRNPIRTIDSIEISEHGDMILVDLRAESFLWNMARRIVWALDAASKGEIDPGEVEPGRERGRRAGLAPPEALVLMDIDCGVEFMVDDRIVKSVAAEMERRRARACVSYEFSKQLLSALRPSPHRED